MAITDRIRTAARWAFGSERPASLSLAEGGKGPDTTERGSSSVSYASSPGGTARLIDPEYKYELRGRQGGKMYQRMRWSDPHIWGLRQAQNLPMLQAQAKMEPAPGGVKNAQGVIENPDAAAKAELAERLLLNDFPWRSFLQDSLLSLDYGFSCFEIVWRIEDGEARCRLALRPSSSIWVEDIHVKDGAIDHVVQRPIDGGERTIPGEKIVWFAHQKEGDSFTGRSIMRPMYKPWKIKEELEIELPIMARKLGGVPDIETDDEPDDETAATLDNMGRRFGLTPDAFFRHTADTRITLLTGNANISDILEAIKQRDTEITSVCQAQVFDLGTSNSGSRALGTTLSDLFNNGIQAEAKAREDVLNARGGLVHQLIAENFPRDDNLPKLRFGAVQAVDLKSFAQALLWFSQAFPSLPDELQEWARSETGMPEGTTEQVVVDAQKALPASAPSATTTPESDPAQGGAQASEAPHSHVGLQLSELRQPRGVEVYLNLAELVARFDDSRTAIRVATQGTRDALVTELAKRAKDAAAKGDLAKFAAGAPPMVDKLAAEVKAVLADFYAAGHAQVVDELQRQRDGELVDPGAAGNRMPPTVLAEKKPPKKTPLGAFPEDIVQQAEIVARSLAQATLAAVAAQALRSLTVPMTDAVLADMAMRASDAAALQMTATVTDLMQAGRAAQAAVEKDVELCVYSTLLDERACDTCAGMDGETTTDLAMAEGWTPNPACDGGDNCRCMTIYELRQEGS